MARQEHDREDLLHEATALVERIEFRLPAFTEPVVVGFRRDGAGAIYFGADPVFQFNAANELRRAYVDGKLLKAVRGELISLERQRTDTEVQLLAQNLSATEKTTCMSRLDEHLQRLREELSAQRFEVVGQIPLDGNVLARVKQWLEKLAGEIRIAHVPNATRPPSKA